MSAHATTLAITVWADKFPSFAPFVCAPISSGSFIHQHLQIDYSVSLFATHYFDRPDENPDHEGDYQQEKQYQYKIAHLFGCPSSHLSSPGSLLSPPTHASNRHREAASHLSDLAGDSALNLAPLAVAVTIGARRVADLTVAVCQ